MKIDFHLKVRLILAALLCGLGGQGGAKDLGTVGAVYLIAETDLLQAMKFNAATNAGKFQTQWNRFIERAIDRPQRAAGLSRTEHARMWSFGPSNAYSLKKTLVFYDADDLDQVRFVQRLDKQLKGRDMLVLVGGSVTSQVKLFQKTVYFDQSGRLTSHFQISHVPAFIVQEGKRLRISEVLPE